MKRLLVLTVLLASPASAGDLYDADFAIGFKGWQQLTANLVQKPGAKFRSFWGPGRAYQIGELSVPAADGLMVLRRTHFRDGSTKEYICVEGSTHIVRHCYDIYTGVGVQVMRDPNNPNLWR